MSILTKQEIENLTGRSQPAAQIRWLKQRQWLFETGADGLPKVAQAHFERKMVFPGEPNPGPAASPGEQTWRVNFDAIRSKPTN